MNNPFKNFFSRITNFAAGTEDSAVGIDIGSSSIKVVEIRKKAGKAILETYGAIALGPYDSLDAGTVTNLPVDKTVEALKEVLKQSGVTSTGGAFAIPVQSSLVFTIELPYQVKEAEISSIVPTEARKYIPAPITEVSFEEMNTEVSNADAPPKPKDKKTVLVVATQNDAVSKYRSIVSQCRLAASFFEIEIFSSIRSNFEHELSPVLLLDLGASRTKLSIVEFGMVPGYHTIEGGRADITQAISQSLCIPFAEAERMKKEFGLFGNGAEKS